MGTVSNATNNSLTTDFKTGNNLKILQPSDQIKELQTIIRDKYGKSSGMPPCITHQSYIFLPGTPVAVILNFMPIV